MSNSTDAVPCERCGMGGAVPYSFRYGNPPGAIGGVSAAYVCDHCLMRAKARRALKVMVREAGGFPLLLLVYALPVIWLGNTAWEAQWGRAALWLLAVVGVPAVLGGLIYLLTPSVATGQQVAIELRKPSLRAEGWTAYWTDKEFARRSPARLTRP